MMRVDEAGQDDLPGEIEDGIGRRRQLGRRPDLLDDAVLRKQSGIFQFSATRIHGHQDLGVLYQERCHFGVIRRRMRASGSCTGRFRLACNERRARAVLPSTMQNAHPLTAGNLEPWTGNIIDLTLSDGTHRIGLLEKVDGLYVQLRSGAEAQPLPEGGKVPDFRHRGADSASRTRALSGVA